MNADTSHTASAHGRANPLPDHTEAGHGTLQGYLTGFGLSVVLTAVPFYVVMHHVFSNHIFTAALVMAFAAAQILVHMVYFLHMNTHSEGGWTLLALMFTMVLLGITLSGSIWVMYHLNTNMMPVTMHDMRNMP